MSKLRLLFITNVPALARYVTTCGVDRVMVDLEIKGKEARQGHLSTVISRHELRDVGNVRAATPPGRLLVRINPLDRDTAEEVDAVIAAGADAIMLPMFRCHREVAALVAMIRGRAKVVPLIETIDALQDIEAIAALDGVDEMHIGLNDLSLEFGLSFMFDLLANGTLDDAATKLRGVGKPFAIGGIARVDEGLLPAQIVIAEHVRLGSTGAILSRTFHRNVRSVAQMEAELDFKSEIKKLEQAYIAAMRQTADDLIDNHRDLKNRVDEIKAAFSRP